MKTVEQITRVTFITAVAAWIDHHFAISHDSNLLKVSGSGMEIYTGMLNFTSNHYLTTRPARPVRWIVAQKFGSDIFSDRSERRFKFRLLAAIESAAERVFKYFRTETGTFYYITVWKEFAFISITENVGHVGINRQHDKYIFIFCHLRCWSVVI